MEREEEEGPSYCLLLIVTEISSHHTSWCLEKFPCNLQLVVLSLLRCCVVYAYNIKM